MYNQSSPQVAMLPAVFQSHKKVRAAVMERGDYNDYRGWEHPEDEDRYDEGYLVEYLDGGAPNDLRHEGYISWTPKEQFDNGYTRASPVCNKIFVGFGDVIAGLKKGKRYARTGWNGSNMFIFLVIGSKFVVNRPPLNEIYEEGHEVTYRPHIDIQAADGAVVVWTASQSDLIAEDWIEVTIV